MGGKITMVIRRENGETHQFKTLTGIEDHLFQNLEFNSGNFDLAITQFIDFLEKDEHHSTRVHSLYPYHYGILVIDFQDKAIHSLQSYNDPGDIMFGRFSPSFYCSNKDLLKFNVLMRKNFLDVFYSGKNLGTVQDFFNPSVNTDTISQFVVSLFKKSQITIKGMDISNAFLLTLKPKGMRYFKVHYYDIEADPEYNTFDKNQLQTNLINSGFHLSSQDRNEWDAFN